MSLTTTHSSLLQCGYWLVGSRAVTSTILTQHYILSKVLLQHWRQSSGSSNPYSVLTLCYLRSVVRETTKTSFRSRVNHRSCIASVSWNSTAPFSNWPPSLSWTERVGKRDLIPTWNVTPRTARHGHPPNDGERLLGRLLLTHCRLFHRILATPRGMWKW